MRAALRTRPQNREQGILVRGRLMTEAAQEADVDQAGALIQRDRLLLRVPPRRGRARMVLRGDEGVVAQHLVPILGVLELRGEVIARARPATHERPILCSEYDHFSPVTRGT